MKILKAVFKNKWTILSVSIPMILFIKFCEDMINNEFTSFDNYFYRIVSEHITKDMTNAMKIITLFGSITTLSVITIIITVYIVWKKKKYLFLVWLIIINLLVSSLLNEALKIIFHRIHPSTYQLADAVGYSFPSGHSMTGMCFYGLMIFLCLKYMKHYSKYIISGLLTFLAIAIGVSRIYLGVHYASDVLAGFTVGLAWLAVYILLVDRSGFLKESRAI